MLSKIDTDQSGSLSAEEWVLWWLKRVSVLPNPLRQQETIALNMFKKLDTDNSGYLDSNEFNNLLLSLGAELSQEELLEALAEIDEDGNGKIEASEFISWWTHRASKKRNNYSLVSLKLKKLANKAAQIFYTDVFTAAWKGDLDLLKSFLMGEKRLAQAVDTSEQGGGWTALHYCCYQGHQAAAELLLDAGAKVNATNDLGMTPLFYSSQRGHQDLCEFLLQRNADPSLSASDPSVSPDLFFCPADFCVDYPLLRQLFEDHPRCSPPKKLPAYAIQPSLLSNGTLSISINIPVRDYPTAISSLPLRNWEIVLSFEETSNNNNKEDDTDGNPSNEDEDAYGNEDFESEKEDSPVKKAKSAASLQTIAYTVPAGSPSIDQKIEVAISSKSWLSKLLECSPVEVTVKVAGAHCLSKGPSSAETAVDTSEYFKSNIKRIAAVKPTPSPPVPAIDVNVTTDALPLPTSSSSKSSSSKAKEPAPQPPRAPSVPPAARVAGLSAEAQAKRSDDSKSKPSSKRPAK